MKKIIFTFFMLLVLNVSNAASGSTSFGLIGHIIVAGGGLVYITTENGISGSPACNISNRYVINTNTLEGKNLYTLFTVAYAANKEVYITGAGSCNIDHNAESIKVAASPFG